MQQWQLRSSTDKGTSCYVGMKQVVIYVANVYVFNFVTEQENFSVFAERSIQRSVFVEGNVQQWQRATSNICGENDVSDQPFTL